MKILNIPSVLGLAMPFTLALGFVWTSSVNSDDDNDRRGAMQLDAAYAEECGACHLAYSADWLPQRSWKKLMSGLEDHFGDNAELDAVTLQHISDWLERNAAEVSETRTALKMNRSIPGSQTPLRISGTRYFQRKHHEVPERLVAGNLKVKSFSHCDSCHQNADKGRFDEDEISIPGYGRWED